MTTHYVTNLLRRWSSLVALLAILGPGISRADEWFVKVEGTPGDLTEGPFAGWTRVNAVGAFVSVKVDTNGTTTRALSCEINKAFDRLSPALLKSCGAGERFGRMTFAYVLSQPKATQQRIVLRNVLVSSVRHAGSQSASTPEFERVAIVFDKIEWSGFDLDETGGVTGGQTAAFNVLVGEGELRLRPAFRATLSRQDGRQGILISWAAEADHRYRILSRATFDAPWKTLREHSAREDGTASEFIPTDTPSLFLRVEEIE